MSIVDPESIGPASASRVPTLRDVAALSGVARSTVSRALLHPEMVHGTTRERVEKAARALGYKSAGRLRPAPAGRLGTVAVLVPDVTNPYFFGFIRSTQHQLRAMGYTQLLVDTEEGVDLEAAHLEELLGYASGFILPATRLSDSQLEAAAARSPLVAVNRKNDGVATVVIDTASGVAQAAEHLASMGHRDIAYLAGPEASWSDARRWEALQNASRILGITVRRLGPFHPSQLSGAAAADALVNSGATAGIAFNDLIAIGMLVRLQERGISVPGQLSVVGCDDIFGSDFCNPPLTTVTVPFEQAGRLAVDMLIDSVRHGRGATRLYAELPTHLTIRGSSGPAGTALGPAEETANGPRRTPSRQR